MTEAPVTPGSVEEVRFGLSDPAYPFVGLSAAGCQVELERMLPREGDRYAEFFAVVGADPERVLDLAGEHEDVDPMLVTRYEDGGLFEFVVSEGCPARRLAALGTVPREVTSSKGRGRIVAEVLPQYDAAEVVATFLKEYPSAELLAKREKEHPTPLLTERELRQAVDERLTDRQEEVLRAAYEAGYYERPRRMTGEEIAADLDISAATFSQHIRAAERNLLATLDEAGTL